MNYTISVTSISKYLHIDGRVFGPFYTQESLDGCLENYYAFVVNSPECHHV